MDVKEINSRAASLWVIENTLAEELTQAEYGHTPKVKYKLNPLEYAANPHMNYLEKYVTGSKKILFVGLNPGPWGMCQTGVPFGEVNHCRNFLGVEGDVYQPQRLPPKVKVHGFNTTRREVSGERFWNFVKTKWKTAQNFFQDCFVTNYCPIAFLSETGKNITPAELRSGDKKYLFQLCDAALIKTIRLLECSEIVAIGRIVMDRLEKIKLEHHLNLNIHFLMHPSPANPAANKDWNLTAARALSALNI